MTGINSSCENDLESVTLDKSQVNIGYINVYKAVGCDYGTRKMDDWDD